jgi:hypothetical protein
MKKSAKKLPVTKAPKATKAAKAPAKKAAAPAKKKAPASAGSSVTYISAQIDIGFGNHLAIRGEGPGLSWDDGLVMDCVGPNLWTATISKATRPVTFKLLVNDLSWSTGADYVAAPGKSITVYPTF